MALDVNKIIMESIQDNLDEAPDEDVLQENSADEPAAEEAPADGEYNPISAAIPPAISAGLGALALRNKIRSVK